MSAAGVLGGGGIAVGTSAGEPCARAGATHCVRSAVCLRCAYAVLIPPCIARVARTGPWTGAHPPVATRSGPQCVTLPSPRRHSLSSRADASLARASGRSQPQAAAWSQRSFVNVCNVYMWHVTGIAAECAMHDGGTAWVQGQSQPLVEAAQKSLLKAGVVTRAAKVVGVSAGVATPACADVGKKVALEVGGKRETEHSDLVLWTAGAALCCPGTCVKVARMLAVPRPGTSRTDHPGQAKWWM